MTPDEVGLLIVAGGRSERFGQADKLTADLNGMPLGLHVTHNLSGFDWRSRTVVTGGALAASFADLGYSVLSPKDGGGLGDNIALGVGALEDARAVVIVLADMPFVRSEHIQNMLNAATDPQSIVVSISEGNVSPPILFSHAYFPQLAALSGDQGARVIIAGNHSHVTRIEASGHALMDIDTPEDLAAARLRF